MNFNDTPEEARFRSEARAWLKDNCPEYLREVLDESSFGVISDRVDWVKESKKWQQLKAKGGWACPLWPKEYGGRDVKPIEAAIWAEEEGAYGLLSTIFIIGHGMAGPTVMAYANEEHKSELLPKTANGELIWCQLFSEPGCGSDLAGLRTRAERDGDDWVISGQKIWTSVAQYADYGLLLSRTDMDVPKHHGLTMFWVDMRSPAIDVRPIKQISGGSDFNEVFFDSVRIPDSQRLGEINDGWKVSLTTLMNERLSVGNSMPTGFSELIQLLSELEVDGVPAIENPAYTSKIAEWHVRDSGLRNTLLRINSALSQGKQPGPEASISKLVAGTTMQEIAQFGMDVIGAGGMSTNSTSSALSEFFRNMLMRSPGTRIEGGTDQILRNIIGERVLGLPGDVRIDKNVSFREISSLHIK